MKIEDAVKTNFKSPQHKAIANIRYTSNIIGYAHNALMEKYALTMPQFNILRILRGAKEEINVNTVKERMIEKSPNTTRLMDKLIDKGLISRVRCSDDRRVVFLKISDEGLNLLSLIDSDGEIGELMNPDLSPEEANTLSDLLDKIREAYEQSCKGKC